MQSNHSGFQFMEEMSQRLEVALIRVLMLLLNHIYSTLTLNYNLNNRGFFSLFFFCERNQIWFESPYQF